MNHKHPVDGSDATVVDGTDLGHDGSSAEHRVEGGTTVADIAHQQLSTRSDLHALANLRNLKILGTMTAEQKEMLEADRAFMEYLVENVEAADTLQTMKPIIEEFSARAPRVFASKCIDGRVHGSKGKGYPIGTITFNRTEGNNVDTSLSNTAFWNRLNGVVLNAKHNTPGVPAVFFALGHRSSHGHGCAAHGGNDAHALQAVETQAAAVRARYKPEDLFVVHGMTNTDDMSERLTFPDGTVLDTEEILAQLDISQPSDVFQPQFLTQSLDDPATARYVGNKTPAELLDGEDAPMYRNLQTGLAMEAYLLREISRIQASGGKVNGIVNPQILAIVMEKLRTLPDSLKAPFLYQSIWNIAYTLYQRRRLETMEHEEQELHLDHAETLVAYGDGFEALPRNKAVLVKTGRGNDIDALTIARKVLLNNRKKNEQPHPPLVHINVEVAGEIDSWDTFNDQVLSKIATMTQAIHDVFADDVRIMTTYSYKSQKKFYPVSTEPALPEAADATDSTTSFPINVAENLGAANLTSTELTVRERTYSRRMRERKIATP